MTVSWPAAGTAIPGRDAIPRAATRVNAVVRAAAYLFVASIPFEFPGRTVVPVEIPTLMGCFLLLTTLLQPSVCYRRIPAPVVLFAVWLWMFVVSVYLNAGEYPAETVRYFLNILLLVLVFWVLYNVLSADERPFRGVLLTLVVACIVRAGMQVAGVAVTRYDEWFGGERVTVLGQNANLSAMILSAGLVTVVGLRLGAKRGVPHLGLFTWPVAGLLAMAIVHTGSRGGLLCAAAGLCTLGLPRGTIARRLRGIALAVVAVVLLGWMAWNTEVMRSRFTAMEGGHLAGRELIYPSAIAMIQERPLLGWGPIDSDAEIAERIHFHLPHQDAHNIVLELLTSTGVIGTLPFLAAIWLCGRSAWRGRRRAYGLLPLALLLTELTGTMTGTWIAGKIVWLALAVAAAGELVGRSEEERGPPCAV